MVQAETAWTWWTLPPRSLGASPRGRACAPRTVPIPTGLAGTCGSPGLGRGRQRLVVASGYQEGEISLSLEFNDGVAGHRRADVARILANARCAVVQ